METDPQQPPPGKATIDDDTGGQLFFEVDARHVRQLGQQLVGDRVTALVELVKNAYDADATRTILEFTTGSADGDSSAKGRLVITDDGSGMSLDTLKRSWMKIASTDKETNHLSPIFRRTRAGRKGIGRFAVESLGERLTLWTSRSGDDSAVVITFEWSKAYVAGQPLQSVANNYRVVPAAPSEHGTRLEIEGLHAPWTKTQRAKVSRALLLLQPPFPVVSADQSPSGSGGPITGERSPVHDPGFRVHFIVNGQEEEAGSIDDFLAGETAHISAILDGDGRLTLQVDSERLDFHRSEELSDRFLVTGPFQLTAAYFVYRKDAIGVPVRAAQALATEFGGVRLYRDGLRLLPYGERNDDWLGLDASSGRREVLVPVGNQNFFAQVLIGREANPLLEDTSSREGLLKNEAFEELVRALREVLITAATWVAERRQRKTRSGGRKAERPSRQSVLNEAVETITSALSEHLGSRAASAAQEVVRAALDVPRDAASAADEAEQDEVRSLQNELELLRILASLGTSIAVFSHEVRTLLTATTRALAVLGEQSESGLAQVIDEAKDAVHGMSDLAKYIDSYTSAARDRGRSEQALLVVIEDFIERFGAPLAKQVTIHHSVSPVSLRTAPMGRTTLQAILINLFTNAVKAMDAESHPRREILISARPSADGTMVVLTMQDTGRGVPEAMKDRLFEAFATDSPAHGLEFGAGTGLGLKVVADLVDEYGGSVSLTEPADGYVTCLQIVLPRWKEQI